MMLYACLFALGFANGIVVGAYQYGVRAATKALEGKQS